MEEFNTTNNMLYEKLKPHLKVCKLVSASKEIVVRCTFCGDSVHDPYKGHMYIQNYPPYKFHCFKCETSGVVNPNFLRRLDISDYLLTSHIKKENSKFMKKMNYKYGNDLQFLMNKKKIVFPQPKQEDLFKKEYMEDRLGILLNEEDTSKYKLIYSIHDFIKENKFTNFKLTNQTNFLDKNSLGFLSYDKSNIVFRNIQNTENRYTNFCMFPELEGKKTYMIKNSIDTSRRVYNLILTEGIMDIVGVYNHLYNKEDEGNIFIANCGKSYKISIDLMKKLSILNANINIYSDQDVNSNFYRNLMSIDPYFRLNGMNIYYNNIEKDFGVTKNRIILRKPIIM